MFTLSIAKQPKLMPNVKFRQAPPFDILFVAENVAIGHFSSQNIFVDNSVELDLGGEGEAVYTMAAEATHILLAYSKYVVCGYITSWEYVNNSNVHVSWVVDAYTSAIMSGLIEDAQGLCLRANCDDTDIFTNNLAEPFTTTDAVQGNVALTAALNATVAAVDGCNPSALGILNNAQIKYIITISPVLAEYLGVAPYANISGLVNKSGFIKVNTLNFVSSSTTPHYGGFFAGIPVVADSFNVVNQFITNMVKNTGFVVQLSPDGVSGQSFTTKLIYSTDPDGRAFGSPTMWPNTSGYELESVRPITHKDIFAVYAIPQKFANLNSAGIAAQKCTLSAGLRNLGNLGRGSQQAGAARHIKLLGYPYTYYTVKTAAGDSITITPQTHYRGDTVNAPEVWIGVAFIGGDMPRLQGYLYTRDSAATPLEDASILDTFTIRNYPALSLNLDGTLATQTVRELQAARGAAATRAIAAVNTSAAMISSKAAEAGVKGEVNAVMNKGLKGAINPAGTALSALSGGIKGAVGSLWDSAWDRYENGVNGYNTMAAIDSGRITAAAGNIITPEGGQISGNSYALQVAMPPCAVFERGSPISERCASMSYIDEYGSAINSVINPITNTGSVLGGAAKLAAVDGRTYYLMNNLRITGSMPAGWRENIQNLFISGVFLLD